MEDLISTLIAYYGETFTVVIFAAIMVFAIIVLLSPIIIWNIYIQTIRATSELIKLNELIEGLIPKPQSNDKLEGEASEDIKADETIKEQPKEGRIEPLFKDRLPESAYRRKKVFYKKDDDSLEQIKKSS